MRAVASVQTDSVQYHGSDRPGDSRGKIKKLVGSIPVWTNTLGGRRRKSSFAVLTRVRAIIVAVQSGVYGNVMGWTTERAFARKTRSGRTQSSHSRHTRECRRGSGGCRRASHPRPKPA